MKKPSALKNIDLPRMLCDHLIGENHTKAHRYSAGVVVMIVGVGLTKVVLLTEGVLIHASADLVGYLIHGLGAVPFVDSIVNKH